MSRQSLRKLALVAALSCGLSFTALAQGAQEAPEAGESFGESVDVLSTTDPAELRRWSVQSQAVPVPEGGLVIRRDTATLQLESGSFQFLHPLPSGEVTGLSFTGQGRLTLEIPDPVERQQLERFVDLGPSGTLDLPFVSMVLRARNAEELLGIEAPEGSSSQPAPRVRERHEEWLTDEFFDADARVIAALATPEDDYLLAALETPEGWITLEDDSWRVEEMTVSHLKRGYREAWLSLDRDRDAQGNPIPERPRRVRLRHLDVTADLTEASRKYSTFGDLQPREGRFRTVATYEAQISGAGALMLAMSPLAEVTSVTDADGNELAFLRDHVGDRKSILPDEYFDDSLLVLLRSPTQAGESFDLVFEYVLPMSNFLGGASWYPTEEGASFYDPVSLDLDITTRKNHVVRGMGEKVTEEEVAGGNLRTVWRQEPTRMVTFTLNDHGEETVMDEVDGVPEVIVFGGRKGATGGARYHNIGADVINSIHFFQDLFQMDLGSDRMVVTAIDSGHGQAMEGFLHLSEGTFRNYQRGSSEFFHAHEVAHQWWGHEVAWETYRDQWLSEAFASYSAMLFLEASMEDDGEEFREVVSTYTDVLCGRLRAYTSPYARYTELNDAHREKVGPIALGYRAGTADLPGGYSLQSYVKGPMVLHMLRTMLANVTGRDEVFIQTLRDFLAAHRRGEASTADFEAALAKNAPADWGWFFDQWIEGTAIPTYAWGWKAERAPRGQRDQGEWLLEITVRQEGVPDGFRMPVPVGIELPGGQGGQIVMLVDQAEKTMQVPLPAKPKGVVFNANNGVLACIKKL